jgi:hypothetical protein
MFQTKLFVKKNTILNKSPIQIQPYINTTSFRVIIQKREYGNKGSPVHVAPDYTGSDHFGSYVCSLSLHLCKRLFPGLEPMTSWSQGNSFTAAPGSNEILKTIFGLQDTEIKLVEEFMDSHVYL